MRKLDAMEARLRRAVPGLELRRDEPMSRHTTFRVGGPAALMALPRDEGELLAVARAARRAGLDPLVVGNGSNLLVDDGGLDALVLKTAPRVGRVKEMGENTLEAGAGIPLAQLAMEAAARALTGLEFAHGIPGSLGGAAVMNAGAYGGEMCQVIDQVRALDEAGQMRTLTGQECCFSYRHSIFSQGEWLILSASVRLAPGDPAAIRGQMEQLMARRRQKQPLDYPSAGSTFKRPEGYFAGKLIMDSGLRGFRVGGAQVSEKHCGFVINTGGATAKDVKELMDHVIRTVKEKYNITLEPEVKFLGEF